MKYCKQCGAEIREEAAFCPKCGAKVQSAVNTSAGGSGLVENLRNYLPKDAVDRMKELSSKAMEGTASVVGRAKEYGEKLAGNAGQEKKPKRKKGGKALFIVIPLLLVVIVVFATIYWHSKFTLVGVWKLVDTEAMGVDLSSLDMTDPEDLLVRSMLTLADGTRVVFTKDGDLLVTASLGGTVAGLGVMDYMENYDDSFTIKVSLDVLFTTISANYTCQYEFDGPNRLIIYIDGAKLVLTRDKEGNPEEYLRNVSDGTINFNFGF